MIRTLLVDLDGTLLASEGRMLKAAFIVGALRKLRAETGSWGMAFRGLKAMGKSVYVDRTRRPNAEKIAAAMAEETGLSFERCQDISLRVAREVFPTLRRFTGPIAGAVEFIEWAHSRYELILATNPVWPEDVVRLRLDWSGIPASRFSCITHSQSFMSCKPSTDYYRDLLETRGLDAAACLMIGDCVRKDLPATQLGIPVILLPPRTDSRAPLEELAQEAGSLARAHRAGFPAIRRYLETER